MSGAPYTGEPERSFSGFDFRSRGEALFAPMRRGAPFGTVAMILGFVFYWPIGLAILLAMIWSRKAARREMAFAGSSQDGFGAQAFGCRSGSWGRREWKQRMREGFGREWAQREFGGLRSTGNSAFDDWRNTELARLEEERRKLAAAQAEFEAHLDNLRRAKDRAEFEGFMAARKAAPPANSGPLASEGPVTPHG